MRREDAYWYLFAPCHINSRECLGYCRVRNAHYKNRSLVMAKCDDGWRPFVKSDPSDRWDFRCVDLFCCCMDFIRTRKVQPYCIDTTEDVYKVCWIWTRRPAYIEIEHGIYLQPAASRPLVTLYKHAYISLALTTLTITSPPPHPPLHCSPPLQQQ